MIQAVPEDAHCPTPMLLDGQGPLRAQPLAGDVHPTEGERHQRQQFLGPFGVGDVRRFEAEAARLEAPEQSFDLPPASVVERLPDDLCVAVAPPQRPVHLLRLEAEVNEL
jgi:hypothetical protein